MGFICSLLFIPVKLRIRYDEAANVYFKYLFIKYTLLPEKKSGKTPFLKRVFEKLFKVKDRKSKKPKKTAPKEKKKTSLSEKLDFLSFISELFAGVLKKFLRHLKVKLSVVNITVATDEPAKTAITYGIFSQAVAYSLETLNSLTRVKKGFRSDINVSADFIGNETSMKIDITLYYRPIRAIGLLFSALLQFTKRNAKNKQYKTEE